MALADVRVGIVRRLIVVWQESRGDPSSKGDFMRATQEQPGLQTMRCMEIRGGHGAVEEALTLSGMDAWVYSRPHNADSAGGGDVHYLSLCGGGAITRMIVADVSGHGAEVAEVAGKLRALMRKNISSKSQTRLVRDLNREFSAMAESRRFATAVVATYLAYRKRLTLCNAGHPRPLWYRAEPGEWLILNEESAGRVAERGNLPLGVDDDAPYTQFSVALDPGDLILFYTDALTEAKHGDGAMLGEEGLLDAVRRLDPADPAHLGPALLDAVERHRGGQPAGDDVTLMVLRHVGDGPKGPGSVGEMVEVVSKMLGLKTV